MLGGLWGASVWGRAKLGKTQQEGTRAIPGGHAGVCAHASAHATLHHWRHWLWGQILYYVLLVSTSSSHLSLLWHLSIAWYCLDSLLVSAVHFQLQLVVIATPHKTTVMSSSTWYTQEHYYYYFQSLFVCGIFYYYFYYYHSCMFVCAHETVFCWAEAASILHLYNTYY